MRIRMTLAIAALALTVPMLASTTIYTSYESVRQGLLKNSLKDVQAGATQLAAEATKAKQPEIAKQATAVAGSTDLAKARASFSALSDEMIKTRPATGDRPAVYYCSMVKKSWLQPKGKVGNPYDPSMAMCGELKAE